jgi:predicted ester cyclase
MEPREVAERYFKSANNRDLKAIEQLLHPDIHVTVGTIGVEEGRQAVLESMQKQFTAFPDGRAEIRNMVAQGSTVVVEYAIRGTQSGPLQKFDKSSTQPPTNKLLENIGVDVLEVEGDQIRRVRTYYDRVPILLALGHGLDQASPVRLPRGATVPHR